MSLNDILKTIKSEAESEAREIQEAGVQEESRLKKELAELVKKDQEKLLADFRLDMEKKVKQVKFTKESAKKTLLLNRKQKILNELYRQVVERVVSNGETYEQVIKKVVETLPNVKDAEILLATGNPSTRFAPSGSSLRSKISDKTRKLLGSKHAISDETIDAVGGFILKSKTLEIDNTVEALVEHARRETEIEVSGILFE